MTNVTTSSFLDKNDNSSTYDDGLGGWPYFSITGYSYWVVLVGVVVVGIVGNVMVLVLMADSKLTRISYTVYMRFLAVSDTIVLITRLVDQTEQVFQTDIVVSDLNNPLCKGWNYVRYVTAMLSPWLIVGFTIDRCICIVFPLQRSRFCTWNKAVMMCVGLSFFSALVLLIILIRVEVIDGRCQAPLSIYSFYILIRLVFSSTLPCILIFIPTMIMIIRIQRSADFRKTFSATSSTNQQRDKSTRPLMLVSVFAFVALLPITIGECVEVLLGLTGSDMKAMILAAELWPLFNIIYVLNFGQNFFILMTCSTKYRKIMARKLCDCNADSLTLKKQNTQSSSASNSSQLAGGTEVVASISNLVNN